MKDISKEIRNFYYRGRVRFDNEIASFLGISANTYSKKIHGKREFTIDETAKIAKLLNLRTDEFCSIFLNLKVD